MALPKRSWLCAEATLAAARRAGPVPADALEKCRRALGIDEDHFTTGPDSKELESMRPRTDG